MHTGPTHARDTDLHLLLLGGSSEKMLPVKFYSYTGMIHIEVDATDLHLQLLEGSSNELLVCLHLHQRLQMVLLCVCVCVCVCLCVHACASEPEAGPAAQR